jgi:hypothetical protein
MQKYKHKSKKEMNTTETVAKPTLQQIHHVGINSCYNKYQVNGTPNLSIVSSTIVNIHAMSLSLVGCSILNTA